MSTQYNQSSISESDFTYGFINNLLTKSADSINTGYAEFRKRYYSELANQNLSEAARNEKIAQILKQQATKMQGELKKLSMIYQGSTP